MTNKNPYTIIYTPESEPFASPTKAQMHVHYFALCANCDNKDLMRAFGCHLARFFPAENIQTTYRGPCEECWSRSAHLNVESRASRKRLASGMFRADGITWPIIASEVRSCGKE